MSNYADHTDRQLFCLIATGDQLAFRCFFYRYNKRVFFFTYQIVKQEKDAEELTQDVFLKLWLAGPKLTNILSPENYLFVIARNQALDKVSSNSVLQKRQLSLPDNLSSPANPIEDNLFSKDSFQLLASAVQHLPERQQLVYRLSKEEGLGRDEIAQRLRISPHTVRNHLNVAIGAIRQYLRKHGKVYLLLSCFTFFSFS